MPATKRAAKKGKPDPKVLADVVRRVVRAAKPEKIILFGSGARGEMGPHSDLDLLVIKEGKFNHLRVMEAIAESLWGAGAAVDVILATPEVVEQYRDAHCLVYCPAMKEGKVVYDA